MRVVLHICCGVCSAGAASTLLEEGHEVRGFFHNPNIHPRDEYERRLAAARTVAGRLSFPLDSPAYRPQDWYNVAGSLGQLVEGGERCELCYRLRLGAAASFAREIGFDVFTTTLTMGRRKRADVINRIGKEIAGNRFLARDFKKKDGFTRTAALASRWDLYRQSYCGCEFSAGRRGGEEAEPGQSGPPAADLDQR